MWPRPPWAKTRRFLFGGRGGDALRPSTRGSDSDAHAWQPLNGARLIYRGQRADLTLQALTLTRAQPPVLATALASDREVPLAFAVGLDSYLEPTDRLTPDLTRVKPCIHGLGLGEGDQNKLP